MKKIFYLPFLLLCFLFQNTTEVMGQCAGHNVSVTTTTITISNGGSLTFCEGQPINLTASQSGGWTVSGASISTGTSIASTSSTTTLGAILGTVTMTAGAYAASVTMGSCVFGFTINIEANPTGITFASVPIGLNAGDTSVNLCPNTTVSLSASCLSSTCPINQTGYTWYRGRASLTSPTISTQSIVVSTPAAVVGTQEYTVELRNSAGCTSQKTLTVRRSDSTAITVEILDTVGGTPTAAVVECSERTLIGRVNCVGTTTCPSTLSYIWGGRNAVPATGDAYGLQNNGLLNSDIIGIVPNSNNSTGRTLTYVVSVTNALGCVSQAVDSVLVHPKWKGSYTVNPAVDICQGTVITVTSYCTTGCGGTVAYSWYDASDATVAVVPFGTKNAVSPALVTPYTTSLDTTINTFLPNLAVAVTAPNAGLSIPDTVATRLYIDNQYGCRSILSNGLSQYINPLPIQTITPSKTVACPNELINFATSVSLHSSYGTPPFTYTWTPAGTAGSTPNIRNFRMPNAANLTVTDSVSYRPTTGLVCSSIPHATVITITDIAIGLSATAASVCSGDSATLKVTGLSATNTYSYSWANGLLVETRPAYQKDMVLDSMSSTLTLPSGPLGITPGTYNFSRTFTSPSQSSHHPTDARFLTVPNTSLVAPPIVINVTVTKLPGLPATITISPSSSTIYSATATPNSGTVTGTHLTTYTITSALITYDTTTQRLSLGRRTLTYLVRNETTTPTIDTARVGVSNSTIYRVTVTNNTVGCVNVVDTIIATKPKPVVNIVNPGIICEGSVNSINANAVGGTGGYTYQWYRKKETANGVKTCTEEQCYYPSYYYTPRSCVVVGSSTTSYDSIGTNTPSTQIAPTAQTVTGGSVTRYFSFGGRTLCLSGYKFTDQEVTSNSTTLLNEYKVVVTDANGCKAEDTEVINYDKDCKLRFIRNPQKAIYCSTDTFTIEVDTTSLPISVWNICTVTPCIFPSHDVTKPYSAAKNLKYEWNLSEGAQKDTFPGYGGKIRVTGVNTALRDQDISVLVSKVGEVVSISRASNVSYYRDRTDTTAPIINTPTTQLAIFKPSGTVEYQINGAVVNGMTQITMRPGSSLLSNTTIAQNSVISLTLATAATLSGTPKVYFDGIPGKSFTVLGTPPYIITVEVPCVSMQKGRVVIELPSGTQLSTPDFLTIEGTSANSTPFTLNATNPAQIDNASPPASIELRGNNFRPTIVATVESIRNSTPSCNHTGGTIQVPIPQIPAQTERAALSGNYPHNPSNGLSQTFGTHQARTHTFNFNNINEVTPGGYSNININVPDVTVTINANGTWSPTTVASINQTSINNYTLPIISGSADLNSNYNLTGATISYDSTTRTVSITSRTFSYTIPAETRAPTVTIGGQNFNTSSASTATIPINGAISSLTITYSNANASQTTALDNHFAAVTPVWASQPTFTQVAPAKIKLSSAIAGDLTFSPDTIILPGGGFSRVLPATSITLPALSVTANKILLSPAIDAAGTNICPAISQGAFPPVTTTATSIGSVKIDFNGENITSVVIPSRSWTSIGEKSRYDNLGPRRVTHWRVSDLFTTALQADARTMPTTDYLNSQIGNVTAVPTPSLVYPGTAGNSNTTGPVCLFELGDPTKPSVKDSIRIHISPFVLNNPSKPAGANIVQGSYRLNIADVVSNAFVSEDTICAKDTIALTGVGLSEGSTIGVTYKWQTEQVTPVNSASVILNPERSRNYILTVTDAFGCQAIDSVFVLVNRLPSTRISPNNAAGVVKYCPNSSITLFANADSIICNSSGNCAYNWVIINTATPITISQNSTLNRNTEETLRLSITANGCTDYDTVTIVKQTPPTVRITNSPTNITSSLASLCVGTTDTLYVDTTGSNPKCVGCFYRWNTSATQPQLIVNAPGGYYVQVTDTNGCTGLSNPLLLTLATTGHNTSIVADPSQICNGQPAILAATPCVGCSYRFYEDRPSNIVAISPLRVSRYDTVTTTGDYFVDVTNAQGCVYRSINNATVTSITLASPIIISNTNTLCGQDTVTFTTAYNPAHTYQWYRDSIILSAETNAQLKTTVVGQYYLNVGYPNGCSASSNIITVTPSAIIPTITANPANTNTICGGGFITLSTDLIANSSYQWFRNGIPISGAVGASYNATNSGTYNVRVVQPNGCSANSSTRTLTVSNVSNPVASANQLDFCPNDSVRLSVSLCAGCKYEWYRNGVSITTNSSSNYFIYKKQAGIYSARVESAGCIKVSNDVVITEKPVPVPAITSAVTELCNGVTPILRTNSCVGCTYTWMKNNNNIFYPIFGAANDTLYAVSTVDTFAVKVNYPNGCSDTSSQQVVITGTYNVYLDKDSMIGLVLTNPDTTCNGSLKTFGLSLSSPSKCLGGCNYEWFKDGSLVSSGPFDTYTTNQPGVLQVRVTTSNGCVAVSNLDTLVQVTLSPVISGTATALCAFSPTTLTVSSCVGCAYVWSTTPTVTATNTSISVSLPGSYQVTTVRGACTAVAAPYILNNLPGISPTIAATNTSICAGDSVQINLTSGCSACTFQWLRGATNTITTPAVLAATLPNYATNLPGYYAVIVRDTSNNCIDTSNFVQLNAVNPVPGFQLTFTNVSVLPTNAAMIDLDTAGLFPVSLRTIGRYSSTPLFVPVNPDTSLSTGTRRDTFFPQRAAPGNYQITYQYTASGCTFSASSVIKILDDATISVTNNYINAPAYEACVGDTLLVRTDNFPFAIDTIFILDQNDNYVTVSLFSHTATVASFGGTNIYRDSIRFVVPDWAKACFVKVKGTSAASKFTQFVQIHNAPLSLSGLPNTICSNGAPIALTGTPSGGTFIFQSSPSFPSTTTIPGVFTGNILNPTAIPIFPVSAYDSAGIIDSARVIYQYISKYTNLAACRIPDTVTQKVVARAVTLNSVRYNKISASQTAEKLDNLVAQVIPYTATPSRWLVPGMVARGHAIRYSGSFTSPAGNPINFLPQNAGVGPSNLNYTIINGVCESTVSNDITVLPLPSLVPIADTICRNAAPVVFGRDPFLPYSTAFLNVGAGVTYRDTIYAIRVRTETVSATSNAYLTTLNPNPNLESYRYQPLLTPHTNHDTIRIDYVFKRVEYNGTVSYNSITYTVASSVQPIYIEDTIATFIVDSLLSRVYCEGNTDYLAVGVPSGGVFSLRGGTGVYNTNSLLVNNIINPTAIHQNETANTSYILTYNVQGAACQSQDTFRFLIPRPLDPSFHTLSGLTEYCNSALPDSIVRHTPNYGAVRSTILVNGVAQPGIKFTPTFQTPGQQIITHQLTDTLYGCITSAMDTFQVYALPTVSVSNITTTEYCTNDSSFQFTISPSPVCAGATGGEVIREGFDLPQLPNGWQFTNFAPASSGWSQGFVGGYGVAIVDTTSVPQNTWMYTRPVAMVAGGTYQIEYWLRVSARQCMTCSDASMKVTVGQGQTPGTQTNILADFPNLDDNYAGFFTRQSHSFIAPAAGNFNFAFHAYSSGNTVRRITLDTVIVRQISAANCQNGIGAITGAGIASIPGQDSVFRFVPTSVPAGQHTIRYIFSDTRSCIDSVVIPITMKPHPTVSIASLNPTYCDNAPAVPLSGAPVGGTFSVTRWTGTGNTNVYIGASVLPYAGTTTTGSTTYNTSVQLNFLPRVVGTQLHTYRYRDPITQCATSAFDTVTVVDIPDSVRISTLDTAYCEYAAPVTLSTASIRGGVVTGHFYGAGVVNGALGAGVATLDFPAAVAAQGRNGDDLITYAYVASNGCLDTTRFTTRINDRPRLSFDLVPANFRLPDSVCQNAPGRPIRVNWQQWDGALGNILIDSMIPFGAGQLFSPIISPVGDSLNPNTTMLGWYPVRYSFTNVYGCLDTIRDSVRVDTFPNIYFAGLPTSRYYCENEAGGLLLANPPYYPGSGYLAIKNYPNIGDSTSIDSSFFFINPAALATPAVNRTYPLFYTFRDLRGCTNTGRDTFTVRPYPRISFSMPAVFCNAADTVSLNQYVSATGGFGVFSDNLPYTAIVRDSLLNLNITGPRVLTYFYQNTVTQCSNTSSVPITVYHTPSVDFVANGGCTGVSVEFVPSLSNLDIAFDSITQVIWTYSPGNSATITPPTSTTLANNYYSYGTDGYFSPVLSVINRGICAATVTHPLIVSPTVALNRWGAPYVEDFQTTVSRPSWYPEQTVVVNFAPNGGQYSYPDTTWSREMLNNPAHRIFDAETPSNRAWVTYAKNIYDPHAYRAGSRANVYSPCFDFTNTWRPMISMDVWRDMQEGIDGAVLEYYHDTSRTWRVLGALNQGIGWYNSDFLLSRPGAQLNSNTLTPTGWTGESDTWENARFRLDQFAGRPSVRFRVSFAAAQNSINPNLPTNQQLQGFAFDSVWIGERGRNVLVEHFTNYNYSNVNTIDGGLYNKIFTNINGRDVNLIQYNTGHSSSSDQLFIFDSVDVNVRRLYYGIDDDNRAIVDGTRRGDGTTENLDLNELDYDMLQFPAFSIFINPLTVQQTATGYDVTVGGSVLANKVMPQRDYRFRTVIVEDSILSQPDPSGSIPSYYTMGVMRRALPNAAGIAYNDGFWLGQSVGMPNQTYSIPVPTGATINPARLSALVFVQDESNKDVYQVATTRDLTIYAYDRLTGVSPIEPTTAAETASCRLYPNPTVDNFTVDFEKPLISEHRWKVIDILGQVVEQGQAQAGTQQIQVNTQKLAPASYFFVIENGRTYTQRQVIIYKP